MEKTQPKDFKINDESAATGQFNLDDLDIPTFLRKRD
jgi:cell division protein FtsZ